MAISNEHFLEEDFIVLEPMVHEFLDLIGELGAKKSNHSTEIEGQKLLDDAKTKLQTNIKTLVKVESSEANGVNQVDVEGCLMPLIQAIELFVTSSDATSLKILKGDLVKLNDDFTVDDRSWFHVVCALGKVKAVTAFISHFGCDPSKSYEDFNFRTPLFVAAASGHYNVVRLLLENGADPKIYGQGNMTPLKIAEKGEHKTVVSLLKYALRPLLDQKYVRLDFFVRDLIDLVGTLGVVPRTLSKDQQELLDQIVKKDTKSAIEEVAGEVPDIDFAVNCLEPLMQAVKDLANLEVGAIPENVDNLAKSLTTSQNNFTRNRWSWFYVACAHGNAGSVKTMILSCGCSAQSTITDENGYTPLIAAAKEGHVEIVALLVRYGATVDKEVPVSCVDKAKERTMYSLMNALKADSSTANDDAASQVKHDERLLPKGTIIKTKHESGTNTECVVIKHLGRGTFGHVYKVFNIKKLCFEAVKVVRFVRWNGSASIPLSDAERIERLRMATDEVNTMLALGKDGLHPNLVALRGIHLLRNVCPEKGDSYDDNLYIFMDYVEKGLTLDRFVKEKRPTLQTILKLMLDVARGLLFMAEKGHIHKDIKPENILVDATTLLAKISDFGSGYTPAFSSPETTGGEKDSTQHQWTWATTTSPNKRAKVSHFRTAGTLQVASPGSANGNEDPTQHQWSWATTTLAALTGGGCSWKSHEEAVQFLFKQESKDELHCIALELCKSCMQLNPEARCSMEDVVNRLEEILSMESLADDFEKRDEMESWNVHTEMGRVLMLELTQKQKDYERAKQYFITAKDTALQLEGEESHIFATSLTGLAQLLQAQGKYDEAKPLYKRSLEIDEKVYGPDHPDVATSLNNLASLLSAKGKYDEAKPLYLRAIEIGETTLGPNHPQLATALNNLAGLLRNQGKTRPSHFMIVLLKLEKPRSVRTTQISTKEFYCYARIDDL